MGLVIAKNRDSIPLHFPNPFKIASEEVMSHKGSHIVPDAKIPQRRDFIRQIVLGQVVYAAVVLEKNMELCTSL